MKRVLAALLLLASVMLIVGWQTTCPPYDGQAETIHLEWGPVPPLADYTLYDYCVEKSATRGGESNKTCGIHVPANQTTFDDSGVTPGPFNPNTGTWPGTHYYYKVRGEMVGLKDNKIHPTLESGEAGCFFSVVQNGCKYTYYCAADGTLPAIPTNLRATVK